VQKKSKSKSSYGFTNRKKVKVLLSFGQAVVGGWVECRLRTLIAISSGFFRYFHLTFTLPLPNKFGVPLLPDFSVIFT
jgi:hypothetical protein